MLPCHVLKYMQIVKIHIILVLAMGSIYGLIYGVILFRSTSENKLANRIHPIILILFSYHLKIEMMSLFGLAYYDRWYYLMIDISWILRAIAYLIFRNMCYAFNTISFGQKVKIDIANTFYNSWVYKRSAIAVFRASGTKKPSRIIQKAF